MVAPLSDLQTKLSPWVRAFTMMTMYAFQRLPNIWRGIPCLMVLDEMPSLGRIEMVATSAPGFRKYGVRLVTVTQSLQRLRLAYPNEWRDFLGNAECTIWMGLDDPETLKFLSEEMLGQCRVRERVEGSPWWKPGKQVPARYQRGDKLLMDNRQCAEFLDPSSKNIIVTRFGRAPLKLKRTAYYSDLPVWKYKPFARYGDRPGRKIFRALLSRYSGSGVRSGVNPGLDRSIKAARLDS